MVLKKSMKLNWNFMGGEGVQNKKPSMGEAWIFSGKVYTLYKLQLKLTNVIVSECNNR